MAKIEITFKTPDAMLYAVEEEVERAACEKAAGLGLIEPDELSEEDKWELECYKEELEDSLAMFIKYGELVTIEFDTDKNTATVLEVD